MSLIKGVVAKIHDFIVDRLSHILRNALRHGAGYISFGITIDKGLSVGHNDFCFFLGNGTTDIVRLTHGISGKTSENFYNLFLIYNAAICHFQNRLEQRGFVGDFFGMHFALNEFGNGVHGARAVQRDDSCDILNGTGLHIHANAGHSR